MKNNTLTEMMNQLYEGIYFVDVDRKITSWNDGAQKITGFSAEEVVSKNCFDNILNHQDASGCKLCIQGCPLKATIEDGRSREANVTLLHKKGYRVPVLVKTIPMYGDQGNIVGAVEIFIDDKNQAQLLNSLQTYRKLAHEDTLTGVANRRFCQSYLENKLTGANQLNEEVGLLFLDIDDFKRINDNYGHAVGDEVLIMVTKTLSLNLRNYDFVGRWGGEEFIVALDNIESSQLPGIAEKIRRLIETSVLRLEIGEIRMTVSIGATMSRQEDTIDTWVKRADELMYQSKFAGKNTITIDVQ